MPKLSVNLVVWNGEKYIPFLFKSLREQTYKDWELVIFDNHSEDGTVLKIKEEIKNFTASVKIIESPENIGYAKAYNRLVSEAGAEYFLALNQDTSLAPDCFSKIMEVFDKEKNAGSVSPRLMKWDFANGQFTNYIDSLGLKIFRSRRVIELGSGQDWNVFNKRVLRNAGKVLEVFGVSAACAAYRVSAIKEVLLNGKEMFDESYVMYKEDVDLAYRLRQLNFMAYTALGAVVYHDRTAFASGDLSDEAAVKNKEKQPSYIRKLSYRNHLATLLKNEYWQNFTLDFPWILWYELKKFVYFLLFDRSVLSGLKELWQNREELKAKRLRISAKGGSAYGGKDSRKISWREIRKWWAR